MKRSACLLVSTSLGTIYTGYIIYFIYQQFSVSDNFWFQVGTGIGAMLVAPHVFLTCIAVIFGWVAFGTNMRGLALTAAILYSVSALCFPLRGMFEIPSIVLGFVGYARMLYLPNFKGDRSRMKNCVHCGESRDYQDRFNRYGFCEDCAEELRDSIQKKISDLNREISEIQTELDSETPADDALARIDKNLSAISELETMRKEVPMFKSSLKKQIDALMLLRKKADPDEQTVAPDVEETPVDDVDFDTKAASSKSANSKSTKPIWIVVAAVSLFCSVASCYSSEGLRQENESLTTQLEAAKTNYSAQIEQIAELQKKIEQYKIDTAPKKTYRLKSGNYVAGTDFDAGVYDIEAVKGVGNVSSDNLFDGGVNEIMGKKSDDEFKMSIQTFDGAFFPEGTILKVSDVEIRLTKVKELD